MCHRIRHAFKNESPSDKLKGIVEADETFIGGVQKINPKTGKRIMKPQVVALVERGGEVRTKVVPRVSHKNLGFFVRENIAKGSFFQTDANPAYKTMFLPSIRHESVNHTEKEMIREKADGSKVHVNTCESFFSLLKRGIFGAYHHVSKEHLPRYCDEFSFRWNTRKLTDGARFVAALAATEGKRLTFGNAKRA